MNLYVILLLAIVALIVWKIIDDFSVALFFVPMGLFLVYLGYICKEESPLKGILLMLVGVIAIVLSIINRDVSIGLFVDGIPDMIMFWK